MSVGLSGKLLLIAITVTATAGGFTLGYFVGKNVPVTPAQPIAQTVVSSLGGPDNRGAVEETRPQGLSSPPPVQTPANDGGAPAAPPIRAQEPAAPALGAADPKTPVPDTQRGGIEKERHPEATRTENMSGEPKVQKKELLYTVQVGAFKSRKEADTLKNGLEEKGLKARRQKVGAKDKAPYKVMVGEFSQKREAEVLALKLKKTDGLKAFVTTKN